MLHISCTLSVCLVLWASLPEIKIDDDDDWRVATSSTTFQSLRQESSDTEMFRLATRRSTFRAGIKRPNCTEVNKWSKNFDKRSHHRGIAPSKNCSFSWGSGLPPNTWFHRPTRVHTTKPVSRSVQPFQHSSRRCPTDTHTDTHTHADHGTSVTMGRMFALCACDHA